MDNSKKNIYGKRGMLWKGSLQERVSWLRVTAAGDGAISKWCSEFSKECQTDPQAKEDYDSMKENLRLKRENEELRKEIAFLKKAAAFFAKEIG